MRRHSRFAKGVIAAFAAVLAVVGLASLGSGVAGAATPTTTTTLMTAGPNSVTWSSASTNIVTLHADLSIPSAFGTVNFTVGSTSLCSNVAVTNNSLNIEAKCIVPVDKLVPANPAAATSVTITGAFSGGTSGGVTYAGSKGTVSVDVTPALPPTTTTVTVSPSTVTGGSKVTYTATVKASSGSTTPTGTVAFTTGSTSLCSATLGSSGTASCTATSAPPGSDTITGTYSGSSDYAPSSGTATLTVAEATKTGVNPSPQAIAWSKSATVTLYAATCATNANACATGGTTTFTVGKTVLCSAASLLGGTASCAADVPTLLPTAPTSTTNVTVTAAYSGDLLYDPSSATTTVTISPPGTTPTATLASASPSVTAWSSSSSTTVTLGAVVEVPGAASPMVGTLTVTTGSTTLCSKIPLSTTSMFTTCKVAVDKLLGSQPTKDTKITITDTYSGGKSGTTVYAGSSGTGTVTVDAPIPASDVLRYGGTINGWATGNVVYSGPNHTPGNFPFGWATADGHAPPYVAADGLNGDTIAANAEAGGASVAEHIGAPGSYTITNSGNGSVSATPITAWTGTGQLAQIGTAATTPNGAISFSAGPASWSNSGAVSATASWTGNTEIYNLAQGLGTLTVGSWSQWEPIFGSSEPSGITSSSTLAALLSAEGYTPDAIMSSNGTATVTVSEASTGAPIKEVMTIPQYTISLFPATSSSAPALVRITYPAATVTYTQSATTVTNPLPQPTLTGGGPPTVITDYPAGSTASTVGPYTTLLAGGLDSYASQAFVSPLYTNKGTANVPNWVQTGWGYMANPGIAQGLNGPNPQGCAGLCLQTPMTLIGAGAEGMPGLASHAGNDQKTLVSTPFALPLTTLSTQGGKPADGSIVKYAIYHAANGASATFSSKNIPTGSFAPTAHGTSWTSSPSYTTALTSSPQVIANGTPGTYTVAATQVQAAEGGADAKIPPVTFTLTNLAPPTPAPSPAPTPTKTATTTAKPKPAPVVIKMSGFVAEKVQPNSVYPHRLHATVTRDGQPVEGYQVTFRLAANSGLTFDGPPVLVATARTNAEGVATSLPIRAGRVVGTFAAAAVASGSSGSASGTVGQLAVVQPPYGYRLVGADGGVFDFHAPFYGSAANIGPRSGNVVGLANAATGYWLATSNGGVIPVGGAPHIGSLACHGCDTHLAAPIVGIVSTPNGAGYWLVGADGGVYAFGDAGFYGSMGGKALAAPVVGMATTPGGHGYWLAAADGGVFAFGSARFYGSMGGKVLNAPIVGIAATQGGHGYWLVGADGGVFAFGSAGFHGSTGAIRLNKPVVGIVADPATGGYWLLASDGGVFAFHAPFYGSMGGTPLNRPVVGGVAATG